MDIENSSNMKFEELIFIHIILAYITKYMIKVPYQMLRLTEELWVEYIINSYSKKCQK